MRNQVGSTAAISYRPDSTVSESLSRARVQEGHDRTVERRSARARDFPAEHDELLHGNPLERPIRLDLVADE